MERASHGLDNGFLDRPEEGRCLFQISARHPQGMLKLLWVEDPVKGVFSLEFIGPCHIHSHLSRSAYFRALKAQSETQCIRNP